MAKDTKSNSNTSSYLLKLEYIIKKKNTPVQNHIRTLNVLQRQKTLLHLQAVLKPAADMEKTLSHSH